MLLAGAKFELKDKQGWEIAIDKIEKLKSMYLALPQTFNHNDYTAENLALSLGATHRLKAIVFDCDYFTTGVAFNDWRNMV